MWRFDEADDGTLWLWDSATQAEHFVVAASYEPIVLLPPTGHVAYLRYTADDEQGRTATYFVRYDLLSRQFEGLPPADIPIITLSVIQNLAPIAYSEPLPPAFISNLQHMGGPRDGLYYVGPTPPVDLAWHGARLMGGALLALGLGVVLLWRQI